MNHPDSSLPGLPKSPPPPETLRTGPLRLLYEPASGFIRRICFGEHEVIRGIYAAVRDPNWDTVPGQLRETRREIHDEAFDLEFECQHRRGEIDFLWRGTLSATTDGQLTYTFEGVAQSTFRRNRIGFCVLHPIRECAGAAARQDRVDGTRVECRFPDTIEPQIFGQSSFRDLRSVTHEVEPGVWAEVSFEGEVFEMEDQRNWTDASFKTYGTPLALPFPVEIQAGTRLRQRVTLRLLGWNRERSSLSVAGNERTALRVQLAPSVGARLRFPRLGLGSASHGQPLTSRQIGRLQALGLDHLRADLRLESPEWPQVWARAAREATELGVPLELALHLPRNGNADPDALRRELNAWKGTLVLARVLALREGEPATRPTTLSAVRRALDGWEIPIGAGTDANFCELNREQALGHCVPSEADFVFWSMNPQVHAFDDLSVMESLEAQAATVRTARAFADGRPLVVSPITLRPRFNPVALGPETPQLPDELPRQVDPRQAQQFAAAWTLGSLAELTLAGIDSLTYFETTGWRGVLERDEGSELPARFTSVAGGVFPLYHVFADVADGHGTELLPVRSSAPRRVAALGWRSAAEARSVLLLANLDTEPQSVAVEDFPELQSIRILSPDNVGQAIRDPEGYRESVRERGIGLVELPPLAIACLRNPG